MTRIIIKKAILTIILLMTCLIAQNSSRDVRCPRLMSQAAEYYHARNWQAVVRVYSEVVNLGCDEWDITYAPPEEIYQYYAIAYEQMGKYDRSEYVLLQGIDKIPNNIDLRIRLAYAYKRQGKTDQEIVEYERILDYMDPNNVRVMTELASLYRKERRYGEQIQVLQKLIDVEPTNEAAIADLATAFERTGKDPPKLYLDKYNNKIAFLKLGDAYILNEDFSNASIALEQAYKLDPRDNQTAIKICEVNSELEKFGKAISWADKAIKGSKSSGEALGAKGDVYYKAFHTCRTPEVSRDDRIVARLAYEYYVQAESEGNRNITGPKNWLRDNEVLFTKSDWFMLDAAQKSVGYAAVKTSCYSWVTERLYKGFDDTQSKSSINSTIIENSYSNLVVDQASPTINKDELDIVKYIDIENNIPETRVKNKDAIAVIIGNKNYKEIVDVDFAIRDAEYIREYLIKSLGYEPGNIIYEEDATQGKFNSIFGTPGIDGKLQKWIKMGISDVFIYYNGHGAPDPNSKTSYFVPVDCDPALIQLTGYPINQFYNILNSLDAREITVVIDACFSGLTQAGPILRNVSPVHIEINENISTKDNITIFTSSSGYEYSAWYPEKKHNVFSYYFMKALQGDANLNGDSVLTIGEIDRYLNEKVSYRARRLNSIDQTPSVRTNDRKKVLVRY